MVEPSSKPPKQPIFREEAERTAAIPRLHDWTQAQEPRGVTSQKQRSASCIRPEVPPHEVSSDKREPKLPEPRNSRNAQLDRSFLQSNSFVNYHVSRQQQLLHGATFSPKTLKQILDSRTRRLTKVGKQERLKASGLSPNMSKGNTRQQHDPTEVYQRAGNSLRRQNIAALQVPWRSSE
jgi:hypothetical protein